MKESLLLKILGVLVDDEMKIAIRELALDAPAAVVVFATNGDSVCRTLMRRYTPAETYAYVVGLECFKQRQQERMR